MPEQSTSTGTPQFVVVSPVGLVLHRVGGINGRRPTPCTACVTRKRTDMPTDRHYKKLQVSTYTPLVSISRSKRLLPPSLLRLLLAESHNVIGAPHLLLPSEIPRPRGSYI